MPCSLLLRRSPEKFHWARRMPLEVSHIPLNRRKALCGRWVFLDVARSRQLAFFARRRESDFRILQEKLVRATNEAIIASPNAHRLDLFLQRQMVAALEAETAGLQPNDLARQFTSEVKRRVAAISCEECSGSKSVCCGDPENDDRIVAARGDCIAPIRALFEWTRDTAMQWYRTYGTQVPAFGLPEVKLSTEHTGRPPHDVPVELYVGGSTFYSSDDQRQVSEIRLTFWVEQFDWGTFLATLYVLFHECVSHAFQGITPSIIEPLAGGPGCALYPEGIGGPTAVDREGTGRDDAFSEGWMDYIAYELMLDALKTRAVPVPDGWIDDPEYGDMAGRFHAARRTYNLLSGQPSTRVSQYAMVCAEGRQAAQNFLRVLEKVLESRSSAREALLRASFDLNMLQAARVREKLTNILAYKFAEYVELREAPEDSDFYLITGKYLLDKDILAFLTSFNELWAAKYSKST
jgi:hypothetical protein